MIADSEEGQSGVKTGRSRFRQGSPPLARTNHAYPQKAARLRAPNNIVRDILRWYCRTATVPVWHWLELPLLERDGTKERLVNMNRSGSQKALLVISIINIVVGALVFLLGLVAIMAGGALGSATSADLAESGLTTQEASYAAAGMSVVAIVSIISALLSIVEGILGIRAANDAQKIMPVWIISIISLIAVVVSMIFAITQGAFTSNIASYIFSLIASGLMLWIANNIKIQAHR